MLGWVWQWLIRVYQGQGSETNPLWTLAIKGCIVYREFNNNIKTNWKVHLLFFNFYHLAPATLNNMSNKIFIPSGGDHAHLSPPWYGPDVWGTSEKVSQKYTDNGLEEREQIPKKENEINPQTKLCPSIVLLGKRV